MRNIVVDIGNTRTKVGVFENGVLVAHHYDPSPEVLKSLQQHPNDAVMVSTVGHGVEELHTVFEKSIHFIVFDRSLKLPLSLHYDTPETLGLDRIAAAIGAQTLYPSQDVLVIDAGSCITIDLVTKEQEFAGGIISPGIRMRFKSMHVFTDKLPMIEWNPSDLSVPALPGLSTRECMRGGVLKGMQFEIEGYVRYYSGQYPDLKVIMTGGDAPYFENIINTPIFTEDSLVLIGLNRVLEYNVA
ncbi:MAG: putative transcriptional acitvator, Baf family [Chitinophagaceae bacterium]|nr:putative transcriptional acitvator, Baf family [Chitinophagaceae bacterium]